jgi:hypothetical protein
LEFKRLSAKHKNNKFKYYLLGYLRQWLPATHYQQVVQKLSNKGLNWQQIQNRVNYYNRLEKPQALSAKARTLGSLNLKEGHKTYFLDLMEYARFFNPALKGFFRFGDITSVSQEPALVKTRPIAGANANSVLLKWNKIRHFLFIEKSQPAWADKKDKLVSRGKVHQTQPQRIQFLEKYFGHPLCDVGKVNRNQLNPKWLVNRMTISEQLHYKFILCLEGNDVASNLKWVMSSQSVAVMPPPRYESWFMEGTLKPDYHYIALAPDYSNLEEKLHYYLAHPAKAKAIVQNANRFVEQFKNQQTEDLISILVLEKYFKRTQQI